MAHFIYYLFFIFVVSISIEVKAQQEQSKYDSIGHQGVKLSFDAIKEAKEIVWYGLDFSKVTFIGQFNPGWGLPQATALEIKRDWISAWSFFGIFTWNNLCITRLIEPTRKFYSHIVKIKRYPITKKLYYPDLTLLNIERNKKFKTDSCLTYKGENTIQQSTIKNIIKYYPSAIRNNGEIINGIGIVLIIENFNETTQTASVYNVCFDLETKTILSCNKYIGQASNYRNSVGLGYNWERAIKSVLKQVANSQIFEPAELEESYQYEVILKQNE